MGVCPRPFLLGSALATAWPRRIAIRDGDADEFASGRDAAYCASLMGFFVFGFGRDLGLMVDLGRLGSRFLGCHPLVMSSSPITRLFLEDVVGTGVVFR